MRNNETVERRQYLSFQLAGTDYAVGILQVKEILQYESCTRVPSMPASVRGVINLRGAVVPVIDLAVKFGQPVTGATNRTCVLIVEVSLQGERTVMGIMADAVREVLELGPEDIEAPPSFGTQVRADHLLGMGKTEKGFVLLLDLDRVVSAGEKDLAAELAVNGLESPLALSLSKGEESAGAESPSDRGSEGPSALSLSKGEAHVIAAAAPAAAVEERG